MVCLLVEIIKELIGYLLQSLYSTIYLVMQCMLYMPGVVAVPFCMMLCIYVLFSLGPVDRKAAEGVRQGGWTSEGN